MKYYLWLLLLITYQSFGQITTLRHKFFPQIKDSIILDTLPIIPNSIVVKTKNQSINQYTVLWQKSLFIPHYPMDSVEISYRVFPFRLSNNWQKDSSNIIKPLYSEIEKINLPNEDLDLTKLNTDGRMSRGIFFGSNQQPAMTSDFSLNMKGKLDDSVEIQASITNNALNSNDLSGTYTIQDFDKSLIKISFPHSHLLMGDFQTNNNKPFFLHYNRSIKGAEFTNTDQKHTYRLGIGTQKGKFNRISFLGQEGNQGPYRLTSKDGKEFIVVISGSEKVYINGELKRRGADKDYIMDYNRGEITFTANCLITKDSRIIIEYEYWDIGFVKLSFWADYAYQTSNAYYYANFFETRDNPSSAIEQYSHDQLQLLYNIGDTTEKALWTGADSIAYNNDKILYCRKDTVYNGQIYKIFVHSTNPQCAHWQVNFRYVGHNNGDYILSASEENGRIYSWVGPGKGDYTAIKKLSIPQSKAVLTTGGIIKITKNFSTFYELARGYQDKNLLSPLQDGDNTCYNFLLGIDQKMQINPSSTNQLQINYTFLNEKFPIFDPFLNVEFKRDWNINYDNIPTSHLIGIQDKLLTNRGLSTILNLQGLFSYLYSGYKTDLTIKYDTNKWDINSWISYNINRQENFSSRFLRTKQKWAFRLSKFSIGLISEAEHNIWLADSILPASYSFWDTQLQLLLGDSTSNYWETTIGNRQDFMPQNNELEIKSSAWTIQTKWSIKKKKFFNQLIANYRLLQDSTNKTNILLQERSNIKINKHLNISIIQNLQQGQQSITEFYFLKVPTGQGQYTWIDFNKDGREQLNEFQLTQFNEQANYIRIILPGNKYIPVTVSFSNINFAISPHFNEKNSLLSYLNRIQNNFSFSLEGKNKENNITSLNYKDTNIIFYNLSMTNNLRYRLNTKTKLNLIIGENINKDLLLGGMKFYKTSFNIIGLYYDISNKGQIKASFSTKETESQNQQFISDNYIINSQTADISYIYSDFQNTINLSLQASWNKEKKTEAFLRNFSANLSLNKIINQRIRLTILSRLIYNHYNEKASGQISYILLQGYSSGFNLDNLISLSFKINKSFTTSIDYQIRKTSVWIHNFGFKITGWF